MPEWRRRAVRHSLEDLVRQRVYQIACGYADQDDADSLRTDPLLKLVCGRLPESGAELASQPTFSRLENAVDRWILKGAVALHMHLGARFRTTRDTDLARYDNEQAATADFLAAQGLDPGDHFQFDIRRIARLDAALEGAAVRYHVAAELAGRPFEEVTVDVGFGDPLAVEPERLRGPDLLGFAEIVPIEVPALPLEQHVAEKVHAYTRSYAGGHPSTRTKDLIDLILIPSRFPFQAGRLRSALSATFGARGTHPISSSLPPPPAEWRPGYRRMATEVSLDPELSVGYQQARAFLDPILAGTVPNVARRDAARRTW